MHGVSTGSGGRLSGMRASEHALTVFLLHKKV